MGSPTQTALGTVEEPTHDLGRERRSSFIDLPLPDHSPALGDPTGARAQQVQGPTTAPGLFTRNNNLVSNHARAGKQEREGNHLAELRSLFQATPVPSPHLFHAA